MTESNNSIFTHDKKLNLNTEDILVVTPFFSPDQSAQAFQSTRFCRELQELGPRSLTILCISSTDSIINNSYVTPTGGKDYFFKADSTNVVYLAKDRLLSSYAITRKIYRLFRPHDPLICLSGMQGQIAELYHHGNQFSIVFLICEPLASVTLAPAIKQLFPTAKIIGWFSDPLPFFDFKFAIRFGHRRKKLQCKLAKAIKCLNGAITVSKYITRQIEGISTNKTLKVVEICHMFDKHYWLNRQETLTTLRRKESIVLLHSGALYWKRSPVDLINSLNRENSIYLYKSIDLVLEGPCSKEISSQINSLNYTDGLNVKLSPSVNLEGSYSSMEMADILLLIDVRLDLNVHQPSKLADYVAARKPILYIGKDESEVTRLLSGKHPAFCIYNHEDIHESIHELFKKAKALDRRMYDEVVNMFSSEQVVSSMLRALDL